MAAPKVQRGWISYWVCVAERGAWLLQVGMEDSGPAEGQECVLPQTPQAAQLAAPESAAQLEEPSEGADGK